MKRLLKICYKIKLAILTIILSILIPIQTNAQNALILNGAYIIENGGTATNNIHIVIDQPDTLGIVRLSTGGHIHSESQYNFVTWNTGTNTGSYIFPFGVGGNIADSIPCIFNKTAGNNTISISTWATDQQNNPKPELTNVAAVTNMNGITDSVLYAIDRFWNIQAPSTNADLTFSYRGTENTTTSPTDLIQAQHWNGSSWDTPVGPGTNGVTSGIGTTGVFTGQNTFSPWVLVISCTDNITINPSICQGDSFIVGSNSYTVSGTWVDTLINSFGCDSIITTNLIVNPISTNNISATICEGDSILLGGVYQTMSGTYNDTIFGANFYGCDSIITTNLTVNPLSTNNISASICQGDSFVVGSNSYTVSGTYVDTLINSFGCDSIITTNLTVNPISTNNISATICQGDSFVVGSNSYSVSGTYIDTLLNSFGCDSIITTNLTVNPISTNNISATICQGDSILLGGVYQTMQGTYNDTIFGANFYGCDSIITTNLTVNPLSTNNISASICQGDSFVVGSNSYTVSGTYVDTLINSFGCDSIITTNLTVNPISTNNISATICQGDSFVVGSNSYSVSGTYIDTLLNSFGCDSIITTNLTVNPISTNNISATICQGDSILLGGVYQTMQGTYNDTIFGANFYGCDSIITTNLVVNPITINNVFTTICQGDSILLGGVYQTTPGTYNDTILAANVYGCDSIVITNLTINPISISNISATICEGKAYSVGESSYTVSGIYVDTLINSFGCDSIITTSLTVLTSNITTQTLIECEGFEITVGTNTYNTTGLYTDNINECDLLKTDLTILPNPQLSLIKTDDNCDENTGSVIAEVISDNLPILYNWSTGSQDSSINNLSAGLYSITVIDSNGCFVSDSVSLENIDSDCDYFVYLPNVFTPNGDGNNDIFYVRGKGIGTISLKIYNRWGNEVFESTSLSEGWDGSYKGEIQNTGVFVFILQVNFLNGETLTKSGDISIIR